MKTKYETKRQAIGVKGRTRRAEEKKVGKKEEAVVIEKKHVQKKTEEKTVKKPIEKPAVKKAATKKTVENKIKETMYIEFSQKSYTQADLIKIAKDVWKFDLKKKVSDFKEVELYVKPEESMVYYVINGTEKGSFFI